MGCRSSMEMQEGKAIRRIEPEIPSAPRPLTANRGESFPHRTESAPQSMLKSLEEHRNRQRKGRFTVDMMEPGPKATGREASGIWLRLRQILHDRCISNKIHPPNSMPGVRNPGGRLQSCCLLSLGLCTAGLGI